MTTHPEHEPTPAYQDPLENYEPHEYDDPIEQALAEQAVTSIQHHPFAIIPPTTSIRDAVAKLAEFHISCLLISDDEDRLVGVFSDRDVLDKVALEYERIKDEPVSSVMTPDPVFVYESDPAAAALAVTAISGFRHVPVLNMNDKVVGIVSPQRMTNFLHQFYPKE